MKTRFISRFFPGYPDTVRNFLLVICLFVPCILLYGVILTPLYTVTSSDIVFMRTIIPTLLKTLSGIVNIVFIATGIALASAIPYFFSKNKSNRIALSILVAGAFVLSHAVDILMSVAVEGAMVLDIYDIIYTILYLIFDLVVIGTSYFFSTKKSEIHFESAERYAKAHFKATGLEFDERSVIFPFKSIVSNRNPLLSGVLFGTLVNLVFTLISRVIYDISLGAPESGGEVFEIIFYYALDIVKGALVYAAAFFILKFLFVNKKEKPLFVKKAK